MQRAGFTTRSIGSAAQQQSEVRARGLLASISAPSAADGLHGTVIALMAMHATSSVVPNTALFAAVGEAATSGQRGGPAAAARRARQAGGLDRKGGAGGTAAHGSRSCIAPRAVYATAWQQ